MYVSCIHSCDVSLYTVVLILLLLIYKADAISAVCTLLHTCRNKNIIKNITLNVIITEISYKCNGNYKNFSNESHLLKNVCWTMTIYRNLQNLTFITDLFLETKMTFKACLLFLAVFGCVRSQGSTRVSQLIAAGLLQASSGDRSSSSANSGILSNPADRAFQSPMLSDLDSNLGGNSGILTNPADRAFQSPLISGLDSNLGGNSGILSNPADHAFQSPALSGLNSNLGGVSSEQFYYASPQYNTPIITQVPPYSTDFQSTGPSEAYYSQTYNEQPASYALSSAMQPTAKYIQYNTPTAYTIPATNAYYSSAYYNPSYSRSGVLPASTTYGRSSQLYGSSTAGYTMSGSVPSTPNYFQSAPSAAYYSQNYYTQPAAYATPSNGNQAASYMYYQNTPTAYQTTRAYTVPARKAVQTLANAYYSPITAYSNPSYSLSSAIPTSSSYNQILSSPSMNYVATAPYRQQTSNLATTGFIQSNYVQQQKPNYFSASVGNGHSNIPLQYSQSSGISNVGRSQGTFSYQSAPVLYNQLQSNYVVPPQTNYGSYALGNYNQANSLGFQSTQNSYFPGSTIHQRQSFFGLGRCILFLNHRECNEPYNK